MLRRIAAVVAGALALGACSDTAPSAVCAQVSGLLEQAAEAPLKPRAWGEMTEAGARLVYVTESCGEASMPPLEQLCSAHREAITVFAANSFARQNTERFEAALDQNVGAYRRAGCMPDIDRDQLSRGADL